MIKNKTLACPSIEILQKSRTIDLNEPLSLDVFAISNSCVVLLRSDRIKAIGTNPRNSEEKFIEILYKKTNTRLFMLRSAIFVEQAGEYNSYKF